MAFKKFKLPVFFFCCLFLNSSRVSSQYLGNHLISARVNGGFLQQETNFGYQYSFGRFTGYESKEIKNQLFLGMEIGATQLRNAVFKGSIIGNSFQMQAIGNHYSFVLTNVIIQPNKEKESFNYTQFTVKVGINKFTEVKSTYDIDTYDEDDDLDGGLETCVITDEKCKSFDLELLIERNIKLNSFDCLKTGIYFGLSARNTSGIKHIARSSYPDITNSYSYKLNPIILGVSLGYQINLGKKKNK